MSERAKRPRPRRGAIHPGKAKDDRAGVWSWCVRARVRAAQENEWRSSERSLDVVARACERGHTDGDSGVSRFKVRCVVWCYGQHEGPLWHGLGVFCCYSHGRGRRGGCWLSGARPRGVCTPGMATTMRLFTDVLWNTLLMFLAWREKASIGVGFFFWNSVLCSLVSEIESTEWIIHIGSQNQLRTISLCTTHAHVLLTVYPIPTAQLVLLLWGRREREGEGTGGGGRSSRYFCPSPAGL